MRRNRRSQCLFGMLVPFVLLVSVVVVRGQASPQPSPSPSPTPSLEHRFFKNILHDQKAIWTAPFHVERSDAKWMIPAGVGWMALVSTDRITGDEIGESERQVAWSRHISNAGSVYTLAGAVGTFYFLGRAKHNDRARETGLLSAEAMINSIIVEGVLKGVTRRGRPLDGVERSEFFEGGSSFPSGHATQTWAVATVIANEYKDRPAVQIAAYGVATAVSVARFTGHKHYLSDVVAGSALGWGIGRYVYHVRHRVSLTSDDQISDDQTVTKSRWPSIAPDFNRAAHQYGVALTWNF
jgi:membrane-associated phospholipid phosphatase